MGLVLMAAAAWLLFLVAISSAITLGYPLLRRALGRLHPIPRANILRLVAIAPVGLATIGVFLCFAPKLLGSALSRSDHCFQHADGHPHFCLNHPPQVGFGAEWWLGLAVLGTAVGVIVAIQGRRLRRSAKMLRQLASTARFDPRHGSWLLESNLPIAMSVGVLRTRTLLSSGLLQMIPKRLVDAIVAHEHAHERRRDGIWKPVTQLLSLGHFPGTRSALMSDLGLACEQACDEEAGLALGNRARVAEALVAMERVRQSMTEFGPAALAFGAHGVTARVESLLRESAGSRTSRRMNFSLMAAVLTLAIVAADPLHHLTETLIHFILG